MVDFLVIGNGNACKYSGIFSLFKERKVWFGTFKFGGHMWFISSGDYNITKSYRKLDDGSVIVDVNGSVWFTNIEYKGMIKKLDITKKYVPDKYRKYDGTDVINVDSIYDIPVDYSGVMGVPINYIDKWDPDLYEMIGGAGCGGEYNMFNPIIDGKSRFCRLLIRRKLT